MQMREKVGKSRNAVFFQWFEAPGGRKVGSLKRRVRSHLARWAMKKCTPLWREAHPEAKMYKTHQLRTTFGSWDVEKVHDVVARSTFRSQNVQNTPGSDHFWKLRCRKSARRCGAKHISKSKCTKHTTYGRLLHAQSFTWQAQRIVHLLKSEQNVRVLSHFQLQPPLHHTTLQYTTLQLQLHLHHIPLHYTPLHYTTHSITLHYTTLHYIPLHYVTLHYTTFHYTTLHYTTLHYNYNYSTTLHYTPLH